MSFAKSRKMRGAVFAAEFAAIHRQLAKEDAEFGDSPCL
jgi:hypothetical protein